MFGKASLQAVDNDMRQRKGKYKEITVSEELETIIKIDK